MDGIVPTFLRPSYWLGSAGVAEKPVHGGAGPVEADNPAKVIPDCSGERGEPDGVVAPGESEVRSLPGAPHDPLAHKLTPMDGVARALGRAGFKLDLMIRAHADIYKMSEQINRQNKNSNVHIVPKVLQGDEQVIVRLETLVKVSDADSPVDTIYADMSRPDSKASDIDRFHAAYAYMERNACVLARCADALAQMVNVPPHEMTKLLVHARAGAVDVPDNSHLSPEVLLDRYPALMTRIADWLAPLANTLVTRPSPPDDGNALDDFQDVDASAALDFRDGVARVEAASRKSRGEPVLVLNGVTSIATWSPSEQQLSILRRHCADDVLTRIGRYCSRRAVKQEQAAYVHHLADLIEQITKSQQQYIEDLDRDGAHPVKRRAAGDRFLARSGKKLEKMRKLARKLPRHVKTSSGEALNDASMMGAGVAGAAFTFAAAATREVAGGLLGGLTLLFPAICGFFSRIFSNTNDSWDKMREVMNASADEFEAHIEEVRRAVMGLPGRGEAGSMDPGERNELLYDNCEFLVEKMVGGVELASDECPCLEHDITLGADRLDREFKSLVQGGMSPRDATEVIAEDRTCVEACTEQLFWLIERQRHMRTNLPALAVQTIDGTVIRAVGQAFDEAIKIEKNIKFIQETMTSVQKRSAAREKLHANMARTGLQMSDGIEFFDAYEQLPE